MDHLHAPLSIFLYLKTSSSLRPLGCPLSKNHTVYAILGRAWGGGSFLFVFSPDEYLMKQSFVSLVSFVVRRIMNNHRSTIGCSSLFHIKTTLSRNFVLDLGVY